MTTLTDCRRYTIHSVAEPASRQLSSQDWREGDKCEPWLFNDSVWLQAVTTSQLLSDREREAFIHGGEPNQRFDQTLTAVWHRTGSAQGSNAVLVALLIIAMYEEAVFEFAI